MNSFISKHWKPIAIGVGCLVLIVITTLSVNWFQARNLDKARKQYEADSKAWAKDRAGILSRAEEAEKRAAALEPKAIAFDALAEQHKAADPALVKKVEEVAKNAANEEAKAEEPADCRVRAQRVCDMLKSNKINADCGAITRESCGK